jgi:hypothetical protein
MSVARRAKRLHNLRRGILGVLDVLGSLLRCRGADIRRLAREELLAHLFDLRTRAFECLVLIFHATLQRDNRASLRTEFDLDLIQPRSQFSRRTFARARRRTGELGVASFGASVQTLIPVRELRFEEPLRTIALGNRAM